jgi:hypothetical protein
MPTIDLRKIKTVFICPDHTDKYKERRLHMEKILKHYKFENVTFYKSGQGGFPLNTATHNILQQNLDDPILILEDDIVFRKNPEFVYEIPETSDAVYFGISGTCMDFEIDRNRMVVRSDYECYNETFFRIKNMLSAHAILYLNKNYKLALCEKLLAVWEPNDVIMTMLQPDYQIYGVCIPLCWQSAKLGNINWVEHITKVHYTDTGAWIYPGEEDDLDLHAL